MLTQSALWAPTVVAQQSGAAEESAAKKAIQTTARTFTEAFNKSDAAAVAALWAEDCEYINERGEQFHGRAAIHKEFEKFFAANPGLKIAMTID